MWLTWANALSASRVVMAPFAALCISSNFWSLAGLIFFAAVLTDLIDGPLARRRGEATKLGAIVDHGADAFFVIVILATLAAQKIFTPLLPCAVGLAFLHYFFGSGAHKKHPLKASRLGRYNGISYFVLAGIPVTQNALGLSWVPSWIISYGAWVLIVSTVISIADRLRSS
ncbi:MAG: CDP-alcohol phosphatidyltransferase family protein [Pseudomonadota bacterium]|nr:CDP-alcohol phosphatidyltransferase family protein [Pseudomonadota bacterium]